VVVEVILITPAKDPTFNIYLKTLYKDQMRASAMEIFTLILESFVPKLFYNFKILINKKYKAFQNSIFKLVLISRQQTGYYFQGGGGLALLSTPNLLEYRAARTLAYLVTKTARE